MAVDFHRTRDTQLTSSHILRVVKDANRVLQIVMIISKYCLTKRAANPTNAEFQPDRSRMTRCIYGLSLIILLSTTYCITLNCIMHISLDSHSSLYFLPFPATPSPQISLALQSQFLWRQVLQCRAFCSMYETCMTSMNGHCTPKAYVGR